MQVSDKLKQDIDFLYDTISPGPYECMLCAEESDIGADGLCDACREKILRMPNPTFLQPLDDITVGLRYTKEIASAVMNFKNNEMTEYAAFFAQYMSVPDEWNADILEIGRAHV